MMLTMLSVAESSLRAVSQYWHMMTMATSVMVPANQVILTYLRLHLRRYSMLSSAEEGKFAVFCAKVCSHTDILFFIIIIIIIIIK